MGQCCRPARSSRRASDAARTRASRSCFNTGEPYAAACRGLTWRSRRFGVDSNRSSPTLAVAPGKMPSAPRLAAPISGFPPRQGRVSPTQQVMMGEPRGMLVSQFTTAVPAVALCAPLTKGIVLVRIDAEEWAMPSHWPSASLVSLTARRPWPSPVVRSFSVGLPWSMNQLSLPG